MEGLKTSEAQRKAVREYEKNNYRLNIVFPKGTKERIEALGLEKTNSAFIRDTAISKLDETNLKKIASDIGIDYIQMSKTSNINYKLSDIKQQISNSQTTEEKISSYKDIYYYFAVPLVILLIVDFIVQKRRMQ